MKRPNILFAIADDASHMSAYGHDFVETPNFDRVAEKGILFNNAFTTNPKCAPSRASILTGRNSWQLEEAGCHFGIFPNKWATFPLILKDAGYHTGFTGKGWGPGDFKAGGFEENPAGPVYYNHRLAPIEGTKVSGCDYLANFKQFLEEKDEDAPFYFWYGAHEPHRPYEFGEGKHAKRTVDDVKVPPYWPDTPEIRQDILDYAFEVEYFDHQLGLLLDELESRGELDNTLVMVTSDNGMPFPRVKGQMYEDDFHLPFAACWGDKISGKRKVDDLISFIDIMPTIVEAAGLEVPESVTGKSMLPIFESSESGLVDKSRDYVLMGRENHDLGREGDKGYPVRVLRTQKYLYVRNFEPDRWPAGNPETGFTGCDSGPTKSTILANNEKGDAQHFELCFGKRPLEELYKIPEDHVCLNNLADSPEHQKIKEDMWSKLEADLKAQEDPRMFGKGDIFDTYTYVGHGTHSWKHYEAGTWEPQVY